MSKSVIELCAISVAVEDYNHRDDLSCEDSGLYAAENWPEYVPHAKAVLTTLAANLDEEALRNATRIFDIYEPDGAPALAIQVYLNALIKQQKTGE